MDMVNVFKRSLDAACSLDASLAATHEHFSAFLMNLMFSRRAAFAGQQIHYLHLALVHLDQAEKKILTSDTNEEIIRLDRTLEQFRSLKILIQDNIKCLTVQES